MDKVIFFLAFIIFLPIIWFFGKDVPYQDLSDIFDSLKDTAAIIFAILGAWIAVIYPKDLKAIFHVNNSKDIEATVVFEKLIKEWEGQTNLTKWDDLGFSLQGDTSTIHWLSSSLANTTFDCPLDRDKNSIFKSQNLVDWLDLITPDILKLDENSSEENG